LFTNTYAFDSVTQVMMSTFTDSIVYTDFISKNKMYVSFEMISYILIDSINVQAYRKRAKYINYKYYAQYESSY